jgi:opacity protein-like surface antigen
MNFSTTKSGWTVGPGAEIRLGGNWTAKLEYLFVNLGSVNHIFTTSRTAAGTFAVFDSSHNIQAPMKIICASASTVHAYASKGLSA